jgi:hypothetical protein
MQNAFAETQVFEAYDMMANNSYSSAIIVVYEYHLVTIHMNVVMHFDKRAVGVSRDTRSVKAPSKVGPYRKRSMAEQQLLNDT